MESINNIKIRHANSKSSWGNQLQFKKFEMNSDATGVHFSISANFLKKGNHKIKVHEGFLYLKIAHNNSAYNFNRDSQTFKAGENHFDFSLRLPDEQHQYINSVVFQNKTLKIHITKQRTIGVKNPLHYQINSQYEEKVNFTTTSI